MGTYIYSGLHPREGTIPVLTFFPSLGGKPVVTMKSCVTIEGTTLQKVKLKDVKAIMDAYEQFLIPDIYVTDNEYDYALLVENLDNNSVPDQVKNCSSKPGDSFIGIIIDHNPMDETYTVGCGPQVFTNVTSNFISINPKSEFPSVQIQRNLDSCSSCDNICDDEAEMKKLLDPAAAVFPKESLTSSHDSNKHDKSNFTPLVAVQQAQSNLTKGSIHKPSTASATSLSKLSTLPQSQKVSKHTHASQSNLKPSVQETQKNASKTTQFHPFTGWCSTLKTESPLPVAQRTLQEIYRGSTSSRSSHHLEEDPWAIPDSDEPFRHTVKSPISEFLYEQKQRSTTDGSNLKPLTRPTSPLNFRSSNKQSQPNSNNSSDSVLSTGSANSCHRSVFSNAQTPSNSTKCTNSTFLTSSTSSLTHDSQEEDSACPQSYYKYLKEDTRAIPDPAEPFDRSSKSSFIDCLNEQVQKNTIRSSQNAPSKYTASSQFLKSFTPQAQTNSPKSLTPSTTSASSMSYFLQAYSSQSNSCISPASSWYTAYTSPPYVSDLEPITSTTSSLLPQAPHESTSQHTSPTVVPRANEPATQAADSPSSSIDLDNFEALKPTLSSCENTKFIEDLMTVTI